MKLKEDISSALLILAMVNLIGLLAISWRLGQLIRLLGGGCVTP